MTMLNAIWTLIQFFVVPGAFQAALTRALDFDAWLEN